MKLEIGPGWHALEGYDVHLDCQAFPHVEVVADGRRIPFRDGVFDEVLSIHCLEHIEYHDIAATLAEWKRVLEEGGVIEIHVPNAEAACRAYVATEDPMQRREIGRFVLGGVNLPPHLRGGSRHLAMLDPLVIDHFARQVGLQVVWSGPAQDRHAVWEELIPGGPICVVLRRAGEDPETGGARLGCLQTG